MMSINNEEPNGDYDVNFKGQNYEEFYSSAISDDLAPLFEDEETESINETAESTQVVKPKISFRAKLKAIIDNTTVEPIMACYIVPSILTSLGVQNLSLEKACRVNLNFTDEICNALALRQTENHTTYEEQVQILVARVQGWKNIIQSTIPLMFVLFVGAWSDKTGRRKACILIPIFGELLSSLGLILNTYFFYELPVEVAAVTETIFPALTGGWYTCFIGIFSYISDITTTENRTYRLGIVNMFMSLGYPIANALSGFLLTGVGYYGVFSISSSLYILCLLYGYYGLEESRKKSQEETRDTQSRSKGLLRDFFDIGLVAETFKVVFRNGQRNRRLRVCLLLCCVFVIFGPLEGEFAILYLFTRYRFNWDAVKFSIWSAYSVATNTLGTYFSILVFTNYLKLDDTLLCIISLGSKVVASFAYAFARTSLEIYLACLLELLNGTSFIALRSIATKLVDGEEIGKMNSLFALAEASSPLVYGPLYSQVYSVTLQILPGMVFLMGSMLILPAVGILMWLYFQNKRDLLERYDVLVTEDVNQTDDVVEAQ